MIKLFTVFEIFVFKTVDNRTDNNDEQGENNPDNRQFLFFRLLSTAV